MPWTPREATKHNKKLKSPKAKRAWSKTANAVLQRTGDEGRAIRTANAVADKLNRVKQKRTSQSAARKLYGETKNG